MEKNLLSYAHCLIKQFKKKKKKKKKKKTLFVSMYIIKLYHNTVVLWYNISRSSQCSTTKAMVCVILSVGLCI